MRVRRTTNGTVVSILCQDIEGVKYLNLGPHQDLPDWHLQDTNLDYKLLLGTPGI